MEIICTGNTHVYTIYSTHTTSNTHKVQITSIKTGNETIGNRKNKPLKSDLNLHDKF